MSYRASRFMVDAMNLLAFTLNRLFSLQIIFISVA